MTPEKCPKCGCSVKPVCDHCSDPWHSERGASPLVMCSIYGPHSHACGSSPSPEGEKNESGNDGRDVQARLDTAPMEHVDAQVPIRIGMEMRLMRENMGADSTTNPTASPSVMTAAVITVDYVKLQKENAALRAERDRIIDACTTIGLRWYPASMNLHNERAEKAEARVAKLEQALKAMLEYTQFGFEIGPMLESARKQARVALAQPDTKEER